MDKPLSQERLSDIEQSMELERYFVTHGIVRDMKWMISEIKRLQTVEAEHIALQTIIENARRLAFFRAEEEEPGPRFKMDANGNLERINE